MADEEKQEPRSGRLRNVLLILTAVVMLAFFFSLDLFEGEEELFSKESASKIRFKGDVSFRDLSRKQKIPLAKVVGKYEKALERIEVVVSKQDSYAKLQGDAPLLYEVRISLIGGGRVHSMVRRVGWDDFGKSLAEKLDKDLTGYATMHGGRLKTRSGNLIVNGT